jgi:isoleucyl-tRNA synthetase
MEAYHLYNVVPALFTFIEDLTNWYIRLNRARFWGEGLSDDKCAAYSTLYTALKELTISMAPFAPFFSEYVFQELRKLNPAEAESVHLCSYPVADDKLINRDLEDAVGRMQQLILLGRQKRNLVNIKVKTPMRSLTIIHKDQKLLDEINKLSDYIKVELNVKEVKLSTKEDEFINLFAKPNLPVLGKKLGKEMGKYKGLIEKLSSVELNELELKGTITLDSVNFDQSEILIFREAKPGTEAMSNRLISIDMDTTLDQSLIDEGLAREVVNRIQKSRKDLNFNVGDRIIVHYQGSSEIEAVIEKFKSHIGSETLAMNFVKEKSELNLKFEIDEFKLTLDIKKGTK